MAKTFTEEERRFLIDQVLNYALETHAPYKDIAKKFNISVATVSDYISRSSVVDPTTGKTVKEFYMVKSGRLASKNIQGIERVYNVFNKVLDGNTLEQIAKEYDVSTSAISRDINERLNKYSEQNVP